MGIYIVLLALTLITLFANVELVQVTVREGTLEGELLTTVIENRTYYSFKGIRYAAPPIGKLRFKAPEPPIKWTGVRDAKSHGASCPQKDLFTGLVNQGNEDCLTLNVYTPDLSPNKKFPVLVYIFGGGFKSGSGNASVNGPDFLVRLDVIVVTLNHRVGPLGFLSLGTEDVSGNAGLKDQVAALRWVKENIVAFRGDPDHVTLMGESSGAASVTYHMLSPMSKGLFKRAIAQSATALCDFVTSYKPVERAFILGRLNDIDTQNATVLLEKLQNVAVDKLIDPDCTFLTSETLLSSVVIKPTAFSPVIEKKFGKNTFISEDPFISLKNGRVNDVDVMFTYTKDETSTISDAFVSTIIDLYERYPEFLVPSIMYYLNTPDKNLEIATQLRNYYFGNATLDAGVLSQFIEFTSHESFVMAIIRFISRLPESNKKRYLGEFAMSSSINYYGNTANKYGLTGTVGHIDDTVYSFSNNLLNTTLVTENSIEWRLINEYCTLITNFVKYGNPTPQNSSTIWPQFKKTTQSYLEIGNTLTVRTKPQAKAVTFWKSLFKLAGLEF